MDGYGWWWHMGWMWIFWIVLIVVIVLVVQAAVSSRGSAFSSESAEEILKRRYARGEIGKEEYERKLEDLRK
jgi:putative membrane protein